jgi:predicted dithiol-disulfide oxidoreductase (DUF899 family)
MNDSATSDEIKRLEEEFQSARLKLLAAKRATPPELVEDYTLHGANAEPIRLSQLFGAKSELMLIHNMGKKCVYCTLWADGLNGFVKHLENRAAFVLTSPDEPNTQAAFARDRGWTFRMYSTANSSFTHDMGFEPEPGNFWPGVSFFRKDADGKIYRTARDMFGPGDIYCSVWHLLDLLPNGTNDWEPKYHYI